MAVFARPLLRSCVPRLVALLIASALMPACFTTLLYEGVRPHFDGIEAASVTEDGSVHVLAEYTGFRRRHLVYEGALAPIDRVVSPLWRGHVATPPDAPLPSTVRPVEIVSGTDFRRRADALEPGRDLILVGDGISEIRVHDPRRADPDVVLWVDRREREWSDPENVVLVLATPVTVALDVVTFPLQIVVLAFFFPSC